jgi:hypothetical protein
LGRALVAGERRVATVLGEQDMADFQRRWEAFVVALADPE